MLKRYLLLLPLLSYLGLVYADEAALKEKLITMLPGVQIDSIEPLDGTNLYEVVLGSEVVYFSQDGRYVFQGDVIALDTKENITELKRASINKETLDAVDEANMIIYGSEQAEHTLTVFTDIDCGYCRKLHEQIADYNDLGFRVRYMAFPRSGIDSDSYKKTVSVWCADDKKKALTEAKQGHKITTKTCENPVQQQFETGRRLGVGGTPALFLETGQQLRGYVPPKQLKQLVDGHLG